MVKYLILALFTSSVSLAQAATPPTAEAQMEACVMQNDGQEITLCLSRLSDSQDREIGSLVQSITYLLRRSPESAGFSRGVAAFDESQRAFVAYRLAQCQVDDTIFQTNGIGNSIYCWIRMNGTRLEYLRDLNQSLLNF